MTAPLTIAHRVPAPHPRRTDRPCCGNGGARLAHTHLPQAGVLTALRPGPIADAQVDPAADPLRRERLGAAARARYLAESDTTGWARWLRAGYEEVLPS